MRQRRRSRSARFQFDWIARWLVQYDYRRFVLAYSATSLGWICYTTFDLQITFFWLYPKWRIHCGTQTGQSNDVWWNFRVNFLAFFWNVIKIDVINQYRYLQGIVKEKQFSLRKKNIYFHEINMIYEKKINCHRLFSRASFKDSRDNHVISKQEILKLRSMF